MQSCLVKCCFYVLVYEQYFLHTLLFRNQSLFPVDQSEQSFDASCNYSNVKVKTIEGSDCVMSWCPLHIPLSECKKNSQYLHLWYAWCGLNSNIYCILMYVTLVFFGVMHMPTYCDNIYAGVTNIENYYWSKECCCEQMNAVDRPQTTLPCKHVSATATTYIPAIS